MSFDALRAAIEQRMSDNWVVTDIAYPNVAFDAPKDAWVRLNILQGETVRRNINAQKKYQGVIIVQVFTLLGTGTMLGRSLADDVVALFEDARFSGVVCEIASLTDAGPSEDWHQINVSIPFYLDADI